MLRGLLIVVDFACFFVAVTNLPLGTTLLLFYASSLMTGYIIGYVFFKEQITHIKIVSLMLALAGLVFIYKDQLLISKLLPSLAAIVSGFCFNTATTVSKPLTKKYSLTQVNLVAYIVAFALGTFILLVTHEPVSFVQPIISWIALVGFSVVGVIAFFGTLYGFKNLEVQKASLLMLSELIFVLIIAFIMYKEIPSLTVVFGGTLILLALVLPDLSVIKKTS